MKLFYELKSPRIYKERERAKHTSRVSMFMCSDRSAFCRDFLSDDPSIHKLRMQGFFFHFRLSWIMTYCKIWTLMRNRIVRIYSIDTLVIDLLLMKLEKSIVSMIIYIYIYICATGFWIRIWTCGASWFPLWSNFIDVCHTCVRYRSDSFFVCFQKSILKCVSVVPSMNFRNCRTNYARSCQCTAIHWWNVKYYIVKEKQWWSRTSVHVSVPQFRESWIWFSIWLNLWLRCVQFACSVNNCWDWINLLFSGACNSTSSMISDAKTLLFRHLFSDFRICSYHSCKWLHLFCSHIFAAKIFVKNVLLHFFDWKLNSEDSADAVLQCNDDHSPSKRNEMISWLYVLYFNHQYRESRHFDWI